MRFKSRHLKESVDKKFASRFGRIVVITGARQTGKTTFVRQLFPDLPYLSIEDPVSVDAYKQLSASEWYKFYPRAVLDEIQKEPQLLESIKSVYDQYSDAAYLILGSSQILLQKKVRESLAGRCHLVEMFPLTLPEMLTKRWDEVVDLSWFQKLLLERETDRKPFNLLSDHAERKKCYNDYLSYGGYPAIADETVTHEEKRDWLRNYVKTYLERDIRDLAELRYLDPFVKVQKLIAIHTAQLVNHSQIAADAGVSGKTVQRFIQYMGMSYQTLLLSSWSRNTKKRLVKSPKIHFLDIGVMRSVLNKQGELDGHQFESAIVAELYKQCRALQLDLPFYHLRTSDGREVDLLIEKPDGYIAIEVKLSKHVRKTDARHLRNIEDILDKPVLNRIVLSNDLKTKVLEDDVMAISAVQFLT